jgi:hypothetical protein
MPPHTPLQARSETMFKQIAPTLHYKDGHTKKILTINKLRNTNKRNNNKKIDLGIKKYLLLCMENLKTTPKI